MTDKQIQKLAEELKQAGVLNWVTDFGKKWYQGMGTRALRAGETVPKQIRTMGGYGGEAKFVGMAEKTNPNLPEGFGHGFVSMFNPKHMLAEIGHNVGQIREKGVLNFFENQVQDATRFNKAGGTWKRSIPGQVLNVAMTGPGIAATDMLMPTGEPMSKKLTNAGTDMALWGLSPRLGGAAMIGRLGFDMAKQLRKPKITPIQNETNIIQ